MDKDDTAKAKTNGIIQTVLGRMDCDGIGFCQCHEHLFIEKGKSCEVNPLLFMDDLDRSVEELVSYKRSGGDLVVDAQPGGCGRMAGKLKEASRMSNVNIVATTGFHKLVFYPENHWIFEYHEDQLSDLFIREITKGMASDGSRGEPGQFIDSKAGIIKAALDACGISDEYKKAFDAVANAAAETGAPVMLHIETGADALEALYFFNKKSISPDSLIFCHLDRSEKDMGIHKELAGSGAFLEYDTIGRFKYHSDEKEMELIADLVDSGFKKNLLLGFDSTRDRLKSYGGDIGLDYINTIFIPELLKFGFKKETIDKFTRDNPKKALSFNNR